MKQIFTILLILVFLVSNIYCQKFTPYKSRLQLTPLLGTSISLTKQSTKLPIDYLISCNDAAYYIQPASITYFFSKHFGVAADFRVIFSKNTSAYEGFKNALNTEYGDRFFPTVIWGPTSNNILPEFYLGLLYRKEFGRFFVYPKLSLGITTYDTAPNWMLLKEKNSNNNFELLYNITGGKISFIIAGSTKLGYKLSKRIYFNIEPMYSYFKSNITYTKDIRNLYTDESQTENITYKKGISTLNIGAGVIYVIK